MSACVCACVRAHVYAFVLVRMHASIHVCMNECMYVYCKGETPILTILGNPRPYAIVLHSYRGPGAVLAPSWLRLGPILAPSWDHLRAILGHLGPSWAILGPSWGILGLSWGPFAVLKAKFAAFSKNAPRLDGNEILPSGVLRCARTWDRKTHPVSTGAPFSSFGLHLVFYAKPNRDGKPADSAVGVHTP